jgi:hypothetical protein
LNDITYKINGAIFEVNRTLGPGFMETPKKVGTDYTDYAVQNKIRNKKRPIASALNRVIRAIRAKILFPSIRAKIIPVPKFLFTLSSLAA